MKRNIKTLIKSLYLQIEASSSLVDLIELVPVELNYTGRKTLIEFKVDHLSIHALESSPPGVSVVIIIKRMFLYHLANTYIPTSCLIIIVEMTLFIDDSHFDTNVMVSLTTLLVMYTLYQSISTALPQTGYLKLLDYWLLFGLVTPFIIFCCHIFRKIAKRKPKDDEKTPKVGWEEEKTSNLNRKVSINCVIIFATISFITAYWITAGYFYTIIYDFDNWK